MDNFEQNGNGRGASYGEQQPPYAAPSQPFDDSMAGRRAAKYETKPHHAMPQPPFERYNSDTAHAPPM